MCGAGPCVPCVRRRRSRWPCRWPSLLVSLVSVSLRRAVARGPCRWPALPPCGLRAGVIAPSRGGPCAVVRPSVLVSAVVSVAGRVRPSLLVCWCAVGGWRPFIAVFRGRGGPFGPSVVLVSVAGPCGPYGPYFGPCRLAGRVGLASGWRRWLAVLALAVVLALSKNVGPWLAGGGPCAVLSVVVASACLAGGPCWCRTSGGRGRPSNQRTKHQRPPWRPCWWCVLLACAGVGGVGGVGGYILAPVGPRAAAVGRRAVGVAY